MLSKAVIAYTNTAQEWKLGQSMHLALYGIGGLIPLNFGYGVLFASAHYENTSGSKAGTTRGLLNPWIFRMSDGTIGVVAQSTESSVYNQVETNIAASRGKLLFWTTTDLVTYENKGLLTIAEGKTISKPQVTREDSTYYITWEGDRGETKVSSTTDFVTFSDPYDSPIPRDKIAVTMDDGNVSCVFVLTDSEALYLNRKLGLLENTGVNQIPDISVRMGAKPDFNQLPKLTALYSDTSTAEKTVKWDQNAFDSIPFHQPGTYSITGKADVGEYAWPMVTQRADPHVVFYKDKYYFIATDDNLQEHLYIRVADTLEGIGGASDHLILNRNQSGDMSGLFWAPELHLIGNKLYILFAASTESSPQNWWKNVQCRVMQLVGNDPLKSSDWGHVQRVMQQDQISPLYDGNGITLDMTCFEVNGTYYYMWSQRDLGSGIDSANLMIATMNPENPAYITSGPVCLAKPQFGWDRQGEVNEGPYMIRHHDDVFVTFSGSNTDNTYAVGLLTAKATADLLQPDSWKVTGYPVLASNHVYEQLGPGHNAFIKDENGNDVLVFHARLNGGERCTGMRKVHWAFDGSPILYMTPELELKPEFRNVTLRIQVVDESENETDNR
ncbi:family 43 glycosylhydrolase [Paenibacillus albidus]|nr:family 43 glycosylhydrolase [Paenibacillus albidus]